MRFAILGAGALGTILGAHLSRAGHEVAMIVRGERARVLQRQGLVLNGLSDVKARPTVIDDPRKLHETGTLIIATKAIETSAALETSRFQKLSCGKTQRSWSGGKPTALGSTLALGSLQIAAACPAGDRTKVRWHYSANGSSGDWSGDVQANCANGLVSLPTQAIGGFLTLAPATTMKFGVAVQLPSNKNHSSVLVANGKAVFQVSCVSGAAPSASSLETS